MCVFVLHILQAHVCNVTTLSYASLGSIDVEAWLELRLVAGNATGILLTVKCLLDCKQFFFLM